jgi:hypothetical protein
MPEGKSLFPADSAPVAGAHGPAVRIAVACAGFRAPSGRQKHERHRTCTPDPASARSVCLVAVLADIEDLCGF